MEERGITLIEIIVTIALIGIFSLILVSDFPKIQRQFSLSRSTYALAQNLRRAEDLGLSGVKVKDGAGQPISVRGYGIYVNISSQPATQYIIYADIYDGNVLNNNKYSGSQSFSSNLCSSTINPGQDCVIELIDLTKENKSLVVQGINNVGGNYTSINFMPPNPIINIDNVISSGTGIEIILGLTTDSSTRKVYVNTSGLINVQ